jgi:PAS domain S-box-containing protein
MPGTTRGEGFDSGFPAGSEQQMRSVVLVCVLLLARAAAAEPVGRLPFRSFGSEQGLENLSISQITQTADGLMWFATEDGLYSYDGARFERFDNQNGLPSNGIYVLSPTPGGLWVGTAKGLRRLVHGRATSEGISVVASEPTNAVASGPDGTLWAATNSGLFHQAGSELALVEGWPGGSSNAIWVDKDGSVIASRGRGVAMRDTAGRWTSREQELGLGRGRIRSILRMADRSVWLRSSHHTWECNQAVTTCTDVSSQLPDIGETSDMFVDHGGMLWVTTRRGLAHRTGPGTWELLGTEQGLPARSVMTAFEDREGSMWVAAGELYQLLGRGLWRGYATSHGFPGDVAWSVMRDRASRLWIGTNRGLLYSRGDQWETVPGTEQYNVRAVVEAGPVLYAAGNGPGVMVIDPATQTLTAIVTDAVLGTDGLIDLVYDKGTLWVATSNLGLVRMTEHAGHRTWRREEVAGGDAREHFHQLIVDRGGRVWAAGWRGLAVLDGGRWQRFTQADGFASVHVQYIAERRSGELCVAYSDPYGVTCFRRGSARGATTLEDMRHITKRVGLTSDKIYLLGEDQSGRLYAGMGNGLDIIGETTIEHFSTATGLVGDDCAARAFWSDPSGAGDVMIGTTRGLARFSAGRYQGPPQPIAPVVRQVELDDERQRLNERLEAPGSGTADVTIRFATPAFANRTRLEQQIRLLPMEHDFRSTSGDEARYAQLPHGDYTFEIRSRFALGEFGPVTQVAFSIRPAWWQTTLFRVLAVFALLVVIARLIAWRARAISRRGAARIIARSEASFRALIEESPDAVFVHRDGTLVYANARTSTYLGYANTELVGMRVSLVSPEISQGSQRLVTTNQAPAVREVRMLRKDGSSIFVEISALEVDFAGSPAQLSIARDCTERKALEARLMASDRMASIGTLAAGIAHEINNPLAYLKANLEVISEELEHAFPSVLLRGAVVDALDGATRVQDIIKGVRTFSRVEDEKRQPIEIGRAVQLALRMTAAELRHRCRVVERYGPVPTVLGSESRLGQVFINLLINAAHAMPTGTIDNEILVITSTDERGDAVIEIRDSGCGMAPEVVKRAFDPFFTTKDVGKGTGLGLSICHGIIHSLGGTIVAESAVGVGTTLRITLPAATVAPAPVRSTRLDVIASPRLAVLVIDDDEKLLASIGRTLKKEHEVSLASSPTEGLAFLEQGQRFDVILCDLMMPEITGMELYDTIEALIPEQARQMLFMTGGTFTEQAAKFLERSSIRWLEKPFETAELRRRIHAIASGQQAALTVASSCL